MCVFSRLSSRCLIKLIHSHYLLWVLLAAHDSRGDVTVNFTKRLSLARLPVIIRLTLALKQTSYAFVELTTHNSTIRISCPKLRRCTTALLANRGNRCLTTREEQRCLRNRRGFIAMIGTIGVLKELLLALSLLKVGGTL